MRGLHLSGATVVFLRVLMVLGWLGLAGGPALAVLAHRRSGALLAELDRLRALHLDPVATDRLFRVWTAVEAASLVVTAAAGWVLLVSVVLLIGGRIGARRSQRRAAPARRG